MHYMRAAVCGRASGKSPRSGAPRLVNGWSKRPRSIYAEASARFQHSNTAIPTDRKLGATCLPKNLGIPISGHRPVSPNQDPDLPKGGIIPSPMSVPTTSAGHKAGPQAVFRPFPRLPPELRQLVWEMSVAPRELSMVFDTTYQLLNAPPPPPLHACHESRTHLATSHYAKAFIQGTAPRYTWICFALDTLRVRMFELKCLLAEKSRLRHIVVETFDFNDFVDFHLEHVHQFIGTALKTVTFIDFDQPNPPKDDWWWYWDPILQRFYWSCKPVSFYTRVVHCHDTTIEGFTTDNYVKMERARRRKQIARGDVFYSDYEMSDSDEEPDVEIRERKDYHGVGCQCGPRKSTPFITHD